MTHDDLWKAVLGEIELSISQAQFNTWFKNTSIFSLENGSVVISVPNAFAKEWLENKYKMILLRIFSKHDPLIREVFCQVAPQNKLHPLHTRPMSNIKTSDYTENTIIDPLEKTFLSPEKTVYSDISTTYPQINPINTSFKTNLNPRYTFETFIVGANNELARAACQAVADNLGTVYNPLFLYGPVGLGKTHLLQSIGNYILAGNPKKNILYTTTEHFTHELINSIKNKEMDSFKARYQMIDLLIIDDVQFLSGKEKTQYEFFNIFNTLYQSNKQIVISSDRPPKAIATLEDRLRSRFEGGMIADINRPDFETRMAILTSKAAQKNFYLSEEVAQYITENITDNVRELEGALNRIIAISDFQNEHVITIASAKKILNELIESGKKKGVTENDIIQTVCNHYNTTLEDLCKKGRKKEISHQRQVAMFLLRNELQASYTGIGSRFGGRDHTTALHAYEKINKSLEKNHLLREEIEVLRQKLYMV